MIKKKTNVTKKRATKKTAKKKTVKQGGRAVLKKAKKTAARTKKKTATGTTPRAATKIKTVADFERALSQAEKQLRKAREKQMSAEQKRVDKLKKGLARVLNKLETARARKAAAAERAIQRKTQAARDQAARARQALRLVNGEVKTLRLELKDAKQALKVSTSVQNKTVALDKLLARFEREWNKKTAVKSKGRRGRRRASKATAQAITPVEEQPTDASMNEEPVVAVPATPESLTEVPTKEEA